MALSNNWQVEYYVSSPSPAWNQISNVVNISLDVGRQFATDDWPISTGQITVRIPTQFASPFSDLTIGTNIRVFAPGRTTPEATWTGTVSNFTQQVGVPWIAATSTGNADYLVIQVEGALAYLGRSDSDVTSSVAQTLALAIDNQFSPAWFNNFRRFRRGFDPVTGNEIKYEASVISTVYTNALQNIKQTLASLNGRIIDGIRSYWDSAGTFGKTFPAVEFVSTSAVSPAGVVFSDTANDATHRAIESLDFSAYADTYYDYVEIDPNAIAAVSAGSGSRRLAVNTYNAITATATDLANLYYSLYNEPQFGLAEITAVASAQHTQNLDTLGATFTNSSTTYNCQLGQLCAVQVAVEFRGSTYSGIIEGVHVEATPEDTRYTYRISNFNNSDWLTLDSSYFGILDQDRLAWT